MPIPSRQRTLAFVFALVVATSALVSLGETRETRAQAQHPIVTTATTYLGTYQGDCWPFMKKVVFEATGRTIGFHYINGYLEAGATIVPLSQAQGGDIVQIIDGDYADPSASYSGMHTAIIVSNNGDGTFLAIDSNQNWDGMVAYRPNYNPAARAAIYGLDVFVFRFPGGGGGGGGGSETTPPPPPANPPSGTPAHVNTPNDCLNLRTGASAYWEIITCLPDGTQLWVTGPQIWNEDRYWYPVTTLAYGSGWVSADWVVLDGALPAPEPTPEPTPGASPAPPESPAFPYRSSVSGVGAGLEPFTVNAALNP